MDKEGMLRKIRSMLDRADHPNTPPEEAATARRMADDLMLKYSIEAYEVAYAAPAGTREKPALREYRYFVDTSPYSRDELEQVAWLFASMCAYCRVKVGFHGVMYSKVVGFERDLDLLDFMFTRIRMHISNTIDPQGDPSMSWVENLAYLKEAGKKWKDIHTVLRRLPDYPYRDKEWGYNGRPWAPALTNAYTKFCKENGRHRVYDSPQVWRRSFMEGYVSEVRTRIRQMQVANNEIREEFAIVLANVEDDLNAALYEQFPHLKPHPSDCDCDGCHRCQSPQCRRPRCVEARKPQHYRQARLVEQKFSHAANQAGRRAGAKADLSRGEMGGQKGELG
jgi:Protein of unknown function (DUF2786)